MANKVIENVCRFLATKQIAISSNNEWLKACVDWYISENTDSSVNDIQEFAFNQLLLADLTVVAQTCLPPGINDAHSTMLQGKYFLQVNSFFDVGESAYKQYKKVLKTVDNIIEDDNEDQGLEESTDKKYWEKSSSRMLKMEMTDGVKTVYGMEYSSIRKLNSSTMVPGVKVLLKGPMECRSGVVIVQEKNIEILGGEVDSLYEVNHVNRLITRKLNMDENSLPVNDEVPQASLQTNQITSAEQIRPLSTVRQLSNDIQVESVSQPNNLSYDDTYGFRQEELKDEYFEDSDIFLNVPVDDLIETPREVCEPTGNKVIEINAKVTAFKSKLIIKNDNWFLTVKLTTDDGSLRAMFDADLLDRLIGINPVELSSKEPEFSVNPAIKEKMDSMLKKSQQVIKNLNCCMTLVQTEGDELPIVIAISDESAFPNFL